MQLIAVSLVGIPGSGKTTIARRILELSKRNLLEASVIVLSFDEHIRVNFGSLSEGDYKQAREELLVAVEDFMSQLQKNENNSDQLTQTITSHKLGLSQNLINLRSNCPALVILDDNMYFRSMRQRVRAICRKLDCKHFQIFLKSSLESAMVRNSNRSQPVPDDVIAKMFDQLEAPTNIRTIVIEQLLTDDRLASLLKDRIEEPEKLEEQAAKISQQQSLIHEMDIITRKELSLKIQSLRHREDFSKHCEILNRKRKQFLDNLRSQDLNDASTETLRTAFHCYLDQ